MWLGMSAKNLCNFATGNGFDIFQNFFLQSHNSIHKRRFCKCMVDGWSASRGAWQDHAHFLFRILLQEKDEYFSMIPFASSRLWSKIFVEHAGPPERAWLGHTHFLFRKLLYYKKTDEYVSMIPFACGPKYFGKFCRACQTSKLLQENGWIFLHSSFWID